MKRTLLLFFMVTLGFQMYSQDYFPMIKNSYWVYNIYDNSILTSVDSIVYKESDEINDTTFYKFVHHYFFAGMLVYTDTFFLYNNFLDENAVMLSNRNQDVIDSAVYAKHTYVDGEWWVQKKTPVNDTARVELVGELTVAAGTFDNCYTISDEYTFAPNVGVIKIILSNETSYFELVRYTVPEVSSVEMNSQTTVLKLYPNPTDGRLVVEIDETVTENNNYLKVIDLSGKIVLSQELVKGYNTVDISGAKPGQYICVVQMGEVKKSGLLIKQ